MKRFIFSLCLVAMMAASCTVTSRTARVANLDEVPVNVGELRPQLEVAKTKVFGQADFLYVGPFRITGGNKFLDPGGAGSLLSRLLGNPSKIQSAALYDALKSTDADVIVTPQYEQVRTCLLFGLIRRYNVKASGYPAKIKDVQQVYQDRSKVVLEAVVK